MQSDKENEPFSTLTVYFTRFNSAEGLQALDAMFRLLQNWLVCKPTLWDKVFGHDIRFKKTF